MHGLGFMEINEWAWQAPDPAMTYACLMLRNGIVAIVGVRSDHRRGYRIRRAPYRGIGNRIEIRRYRHA